MLGRALRATALAGVIVGVFTMAAPSAGAATWTLQSVPARLAPSGGLLAVACTSSTACQGVGFYLDSLGRQSPLAEAWDGTSWTLQAPSAHGTLSYFEAVSCPAATACMAVGSYGPGFPSRPLAESWNGTSWTTLSVPLPSGSGQGIFNGVSCTSATSCVAVGSYTGVSNQSLPLAEVWNGTSWVVKTVPNPAGATHAALNGISCTSATACTAVGDSSTSNSPGPPQSTLAATWNGSVWSLQTIPNPVGAGSAGLSGVSCASSTMCIAVGGYATNAGAFPNLTLAEAWNGTSWTVQTTPNPTSGTATLSGISCPSASDCTATGSPTTYAGVVMRWNGTSWTLQSAATRAGQFSLLSGVSCTAAAACTLVGASGTTSGVSPLSLAERWDGTSWTIQTTVNKTGATGTSPAGVSCTSTSACTLVGSYVTNTTSPGRTLGAIWNGTSWKLQTTVSSGSHSSLASVSCPAVGTCIAVGSRTASTGALVALAEAGNGTSWTNQTISSPSNSQLRGVSCATTTSCVAVGFYQSSTTGESLPLIASWNGTSWTHIAPATPSGTTFAALGGVSCTSSTSCLAVGGYSTAAGAFSPDHLLVYRWNGTSWTRQTAATPGGATASQFTAVSCTAATSCEVVGGYTTAAGSTSPDTTLAELWNGSSWTIQTTSSPQASGFEAVSCEGASFCAALGQPFFAEDWDGTSWAVQTLASPPSFGLLAGVSCPTTSSCTAVGAYNRSYFTAPLWSNSIFSQEVSLPFAEQSS